MFTIDVDEEGGSIFIGFEQGTVAYSKGLDDDRIIDYSLNPGHPIGVCLHNVGEGVLLEGLPQPKKVQRILGGLGIETR